MIDESVAVSESVIFIANISVIRISVILHIGTLLQISAPIHFKCTVLKKACDNTV